MLQFTQLTPHARRRMGWSWLDVRAYVAEGAVIDAGLAGGAHRLVELAARRGATEAFVTHHHEDHSGGAAALADAGVRVRTGAATANLLKSGPVPIRWYQHAIWGQAPHCAACEHVDSGEVVDLSDKLQGRVLPAPGHCADQHVLLVEDRGWLFSGDAFLYERPRYFRADEDFCAQMESLRRLLREPDWDVLLCAHRPRVSGGRAALKEKLSWLEDIEGEVRRLYARGWSEHAITRRVIGPQSALQAVATLGDLSSHNAVSSILHGPIHRAEVVRAGGVPGVPPTAA